MPDWKALIRERLDAGGIAAGALDDVYHSSRASGKPEDEALAAVEAERRHFPALVRDARIKRRPPPSFPPQ